MIQYMSGKQPSPEVFSMPFGGYLNQKNRQVSMDEIIPRDGLASGYYSTKNTSKGGPCNYATVAEKSIRNPTDLSLLGEAREISENPSPQGQKTEHESYKRPSLKVRRQGIREQLQ